MESLDKAKLSFSQVAVRKGMGNDKIMEGVVLIPLIEMTKNNGGRVICKHKRDEFRETNTPKKVVDPEQIKKIEEAQQIANEYVTHTRLMHVLDHIPDHSISKMGEIIKSMIEDVEREGSFECEFSKESRKEISSKTVEVYKKYLASLIK